MDKHWRFPLLLLPPFLILTGWINDNIVAFYVWNSIKSYNADQAALYIRGWAYYELTSKWLLCGAAACIMMICRGQRGAAPSKIWLLVWAVLWLMLLFEVSARFNLSNSWMVNGFMRYSLHPVEWHAPSSHSNPYRLAHWACRPVYAFGLTTVIFTLGRSLLRRKFRV